MLEKLLHRTLFVAAPLVVPALLTAQEVFPTHEEPRHRMVLEDSRFRILDIRIPPGDTTDLHRHETPAAFVQISPAGTAMTLATIRCSGGTP